MVSERGGEGVLEEEEMRPDYRKQAAAEAKPPQTLEGVASYELMEWWYRTAAPKQKPRAARERRERDG